MKGTYFISGIDTNIGKTIATGIIARNLMKQGIQVITQKMIQTGNVCESEDILKHREIMQVPLFQEDLDFLTAPCIFSYPCSPHLAARLDKKEIDLKRIHAATLELEKKFDVVLLEGAGGMMVPITEEYLTIDYICEHRLPLIFVTCGKLGSLNHTLLNLDVIKQRGIRLEKVIFNLYPDSDSIITKDSIEFIRRRLEKEFPETDFELMEMIP
ncbi:MAG: dethiobiotin synthase [Bacteroidales bacterium]